MPRKKKYNKPKVVKAPPPDLRGRVREAKEQFTPAIKGLTVHLYNTGPVTNDFLGYKVPAGDIVDATGRTWQLQVVAVCAKSKRIKKNEVVPMVNKWAIGLKIRVLIKYIIDWSK